MGVYIPNMEMPISCEKCPLCYDYLHCSIDDSLHMFLYNRHPNCPLIEIPIPHGRLGDLSVLLEESLKEGAYNYVDSWQIAKQPTILEAEE